MPSYLLKIVFPVKIILQGLCSPHDLPAWQHANPQGRTSGSKATEWLLLGMGAATSLPRLSSSPPPEAESAFGSFQ